MVHQSFVLHSEKDAPEGAYDSHSGITTFNLDEIYSMVRNTYKCNRELGLIASIIDVINHEELHKGFSESQDGQETSNNQDERIFELLSDWVELGRDKGLLNYA